MEKPTIRIPQRHAQMFELLRQTHQAGRHSKARTSARYPSKHDLDAAAFQAMAVKSLDQRQAPAEPKTLHSFLF